MLDFTSDASGGTATLSLSEAADAPLGRPSSARRANARSPAYLATKRAFDLLGVLLLIPALLAAGSVLLLLNPALNRGRLLYRQERMGRNCQPFWAWKFRSMTEAPEMLRGAFDGLETHRITPLGQFLRKTRIDELPQLINVLRGEMSLIGPRPDYYPHACIYLDEVAGYRERHAMRPGITGLAQIKVGYVDGLEGVRKKVAADLIYLRSASLRTDLWITWQTALVVLGRKGS
jgi:lipopolysaccharide/colanic/teichoic acid biosynthesis glycosyltransferase